MRISHSHCFNSDTINGKKDLRRKERLYRKSRSNANLYNLNYSKYYFKQSILKAKTYYYFNKIQECSGNMRKLLPSNHK